MWILKVFYKALDFKTKPLQTTLWLHNLEIDNSVAIILKSTICVCVCQYMYGCGYMYVCVCQYMYGYGYMYVCVCSYLFLILITDDDSKFIR